jgi:uncharacterized lipoprotein YmbA
MIENCVQGASVAPISPFNKTQTNYLTSLLISTFAGSPEFDATISYYHFLSQKKGRNEKASDTKAERKRRAIMLFL